MLRSCYPFAQSFELAMGGELRGSQGDGEEADSQTG